MTVDTIFKTISKSSPEKLLRSGFLMSSFGVLGGLLGYVFQILMGRMLSAKDFALFGALMGMAAFVLSPLGAMVMIITKRVSIYLVANQHYELLNYYKITTTLVIKILIFIIGLYSLIFTDFQKFFKIEESFPFIFFIFFIFFAVLISINSAFFQGKKQFYLIGGFGISGAFFKICASIIFVYIGYGLNGAFTGILLSMLAVWLFGTMYITNKSTHIKSTGVEITNQQVDFKFIMPILLANIAFVMMTQLDIVLVNYYFGSDLSGEYAAASVLGKAVLYLPGGLVTVLFPMVVEQNAMSKTSAHLLVQAVSATLVACGFAAVFYWLLGPALVDFFYGGKYMLAGKYLSLYGFAILPMALVMVAEHFLIAKGRVLFAWIFLIIAPLQLLAIHFYHQDIESVIYIIAAGGVLMCIIGYGMLLMEYLRNRIAV